ncbi:MAG: outer membrane beta-barrel protein [Bacteroidetes bacterium]|nr:outer membrane beta-barrel protein [Bacteroidota bacterium]
MKRMYQWSALALLLAAAGNGTAQTTKTDTMKFENLKRVTVVVKDGNTETTTITGPIHFSTESKDMPPNGVRVLAPSIPANLPPLNHWTSARMFPCDTCLVWVMDPNKPSDSATAYRLIVNPRVFEFRFRDIEAGTERWNKDAERMPGVAETLVKRSVFAAGYTGLTKMEFMIQPGVPALNTAKSISCYVGFVEGGLKLDRAGHLRLWSGMGYEWDNYRFDNPAVRLNILDTFPPLGVTSPRFTTDTTNGSKKSKLVGQYLTIPLMIGIHQKEDMDKGFNLFIGCHVGYRLKSYTKYVFDNGGREKWRSAFDLNDWKISPYVEVGYRNARIYAKYNMNPLFRQNGGNPAAQQFTIGILTTFS